MNKTIAEQQLVELEAMECYLKNAIRYLKEHGEMSTCTNGTPAVVVDLWTIARNLTFLEGQALGRRTTSSVE